MNGYLRTEETLRIKIDENDKQSKQMLNKLLKELGECKRVIEDKAILIQELDEVVKTLRIEIQHLNDSPANYADHWILDVRLEKLESELMNHKKTIQKLTSENEILTKNSLKDSKFECLRSENENLKVELELQNDVNFRLKDLFSNREEHLNIMYKSKLQNSISLESHQIELNKVLSNLDDKNTKFNILELQKEDVERKVCQYQLEFEGFNKDKIKNESLIEGLEVELMSAQANLFGYERDYQPNIDRLSNEILIISQDSCRLINDNERIKDSLVASQEEVKTCYELLDVYENQECITEKLKKEHEELIEMYQVSQTEIKILLDKIVEVNECSSKDSFQYDQLNATFNECLIENENLKMSMNELSTFKIESESTLLKLNMKLNLTNFKLDTKCQLVTIVNA
jgi:chromosome segregation ATPase